MFHFVESVLCPMKVTFVALLTFKAMKIFQAVVALV